MYPIVKQFHLMLVALSIGLFQFRYWRLQVQQKSSVTWLKVAPHVIDSLLLLSGITLAIMAGFTPGNSPWLMAKLMALLVYIRCGLLAMKKTGPAQWMGYWIATIAVIYMVYLAINKDIWPF